MMVKKEYLLLALFTCCTIERMPAQTLRGETNVQAIAAGDAKGNFQSASAQPDSSALHYAADETLDLGFNRVPVRSVAGAITVVSPARFNRGLIHDPMQLIQGRVPGLSITRPGGDPNEDFIVRVRGFSTSQPAGLPLILIDHLPAASLLGVDPGDIERIVVLRDAASCARYGIRGGNGVILITTKKGVPDKPRIAYSTSVGMEAIARTMNTMSAAEFRRVEGKSDFGADTDWMERITRTAATAVHQLSFSGGAASTSYSAALNYRNVEGILNNSGFSQLNTRFSLRQSVLGNKGTLGMDVSRTLRNRRLGFPVAFRYAISADPTMPVYDDTFSSPTAGAAYGGYAERSVYDFYNPVSIVAQNENDRKDAVFTGAVLGEYDFNELVSGLSTSVVYAYQRENIVLSSWHPKTSKFGKHGAGLASKRLDNYENQFFQTQLHYERKIGTMDLRLTGGYDFQRFFDHGFGMAGGNFLTDAFTYNNMGAALDFDNGLGNAFSYAQSSRVEALAAGVSAGFRDTYFLTASARDEGSSRLGAARKRGSFPAVGAAIIVSNLVRVPAVDLLKIRSAYGVTGNQPERPYAALARWGEYGITYQGGAYKPSYGLIQSANPNLRWERKKELNVGIDMVFAGSRLRLTYDYFGNTVDDLIFKTTDMPHSSTIWGNIAKVKNAGHEIDVSYQSAGRANLYWATGVNLSTARTKMLAMSKGSLQYGQDGVAIEGNLETVGCGCSGFIRIAEGERLGALWGPVQRGVGEDGRQLLADFTGDGYSGYEDRKIIGNGLPNVMFGFHNAFQYKNFTLDFLLRGALGHDIVNTNRLHFEGQGSFLPYNIVKTKYYIPGLQNAQFSDYYVENASYVKLDNLAVGYNIPARRGAPVQNILLSLSVQNLFTLSGYTGLDPEVRYYSLPFQYRNSAQPYAENNPFALGMERTATYPRTRTFSLRLSVRI